MRRVLSCLLLIICAQLLTATQTTTHALSTECPTIEIESPSGTICPDSKATFTASVTGGDGANAQTGFHWIVSSGMIVSGQGTRTITVAATDAYGHSSSDWGIKATVELIGQDASCSNTASYEVHISPFCPERKFDEYGDLSFEEEKVRLESFIQRLQQDADTFGMIVVYGQQRGPINEAGDRAQRALDYLVNLRGIESARIITRNGGLSEAFKVELWVMPTKAPPYTGAPPANSGAPPTDSGPPKQSAP